MSTTIHIMIDRADGSLQRLIGLIERRGFHIDGLSMSGEGESREVRVQIRAKDAGRCTEVLGRQIDRLFGCARVAHATRVQAFEPEAEPCVA